MVVNIVRAIFAERTNTNVAAPNECLKSKPANVAPQQTTVAPAEQSHPIRIENADDRKVDELDVAKEPMLDDLDLVTEVDELGNALKSVLLDCEEQDSSAVSEESDEEEDSSSVVDSSSREAEDENEEEEDEAECEEENEAEALPCPTTVDEMKSFVKDMFSELREHGVAELRPDCLKLGKLLGKGAFGTVRIGTCTLAGSLKSVAVKTIIAHGDEFHDRLKSFKTEALVSWDASRSAREGNAKSRICITHAVGFEVSQQMKAHLHLVMERVDGKGDLHQEIQSDAYWAPIRRDGRDTGERLRGRYVVTEDDGDISAYTMPRRRKLHLGIELARIMCELERVHVCHCDLKPCNILLQSAPAPRLPTLKLIDFGEGNSPEEAMGFVAGTPGYQAPEVAENGDCSFMSEVYSLGVTLVELWAGRLWLGAETRGEGRDGMRREVLDALAKISRTEPAVARVIRRCLAEEPTARPSPKRLLKLLFRLQRESLRRGGGGNGGGNGQAGSEAAGKRRKARRGGGGKKGAAAGQPPAAH